MVPWGRTGKPQGCRLGDKRRVHDRLARHLQCKEHMVPRSSVYFWCGLVDVSGSLLVIKGHMSGSVLKGASKTAAGSLCLLVINEIDYCTAFGSCSTRHMTPARVLLIIFIVACVRRWLKLKPSELLCKERNRVYVFGF